MYDVVIVGAGTAGSVLAERLTRSGKLRVLLLEAGGPPKNRFVAIPAAFPKLFKTALDWAFESEPQRAVHGRRIFTPRGKMLGGSSNMNAMMHQWCHPADFDSWAHAGAGGWAWADVQPAFREQENWRGDGGGDARGRDGPMRIEPNRNASPLTHRFVDAARNAGLGSEPHYNGHAYSGAWIAELAHRDGQRYSAYHAYLEPAMRRANLEVAGDAQVLKVDIENGQATGVRFLRGGAEREARARAVVLAAGAYGSPHLLMLSGVGAADTLRAQQIPVKVDSPEVGENLQDHPVIPLVFRTRSRHTLFDAESLPQLFRYLLFKRGMLASNGVEGFAFTQAQPGGAAGPDLEIMFMPVEFRAQFLEPPTEHAFSLGAAVVAPHSRGSVTLASADPLAAPRIDPNLLGDAEGRDAAVLWEGVRLSRKIAATPPLADDAVCELQPGTDVQTPEELRDYASRTLQTVYHPTSTCRMGSDAHAVVDPTLRVNGVAGLWVADASVMPSVPRGHPNAVVAMIANRGATWIEASLG